MAIKECLICLLIVVALGYGEAYNSGGCTPNMVSIYWCVVSKLRWLNSEEKCSWDAMKVSLCTCVCVRACVCVCGEMTIS